MQRKMQWFVQNFLNTDYLGPKSPLKSLVKANNVPQLQKVQSDRKGSQKTGLGEGGYTVEWQKQMRP